MTRRIPVPTDQPTAWLPYLLAYSHCSILIPLANAQAELEDFAWIQEWCGDVSEGWTQRARTECLTPMPGTSVSS